MTLFLINFYKKHFIMSASGRTTRSATKQGTIDTGTGDTMAVKYKKQSHNHKISNLQLEI